VLQVQVQVQEVRGVYLKVLGSAAGGGLPQWNCHCTNCSLARQRSPLIQPRAQCCAAISADRQHWFLLNASPDIRAQLLELPQGSEQDDIVRHTPFEAILLNDADLDHVLGLFVLREGGRLNVHCTDAVRQQLTAGLGMGRTLKHYCEIVWQSAFAESTPLLGADGEPSGLLARALDLNGTGPRYACKSGTERGCHVAWIFTDTLSGHNMVHIPCVAELNADLLEQLRAANVVLFDGTFYCEDEMSREFAGSAKARQMGHIPIEHSIPLLAKLDSRVIYTHINNTNPILRHDSAERAHVLKQGLEVASDGLELNV
jgi:pyrroloquinoline quinone biosynthesis protein B